MNAKLEAKPVRHRNNIRIERGFVANFFTTRPRLWVFSRQENFLRVRTHHILYHFVSIVGSLCPLLPSIRRRLYSMLARTACSRGSPQIIKNPNRNVNPGSNLAPHRAPVPWNMPHNLGKLRRLIISNSGHSPLPGGLEVSLEERGFKSQSLDEQSMMVGVCSCSPCYSDNAAQLPLRYLGIPTRLTSVLCCAVLPPSLPPSPLALICRLCRSGIPFWRT